MHLETPALPNNHPHLLPEEEVPYIQAIMESHTTDAHKLTLLYEAATDYWQRVQSLEAECTKLFVCYTAQARTIAALLAKQKEQP